MKDICIIPYVPFFGLKQAQTDLSLVGDVKGLTISMQTGDPTVIFEETCYTESHHRSNPNWIYQFKCNGVKFSSEL